ncbi:MAG: flagellar biosynthesis anti-sigma factor FlgM [Dehalococcoidia bacterium]
MNMQPIRPQDATNVYQRQAIQGAELGRAAGGDAGAVRRGGDGSGSRRADRVTVSPEAQELYRAMQAVGRQDDVRADRVDALKTQIESGMYRVDAQGIAQRLVENGFGS